MLLRFRADSHAIHLNWDKTPLKLLESMLIYGLHRLCRLTPNLTLNDFSTTIHFVFSPSSILRTIVDGANSDSAERAGGPQKRPPIFFPDRAPGRDRLNV